MKLNNLKAQRKNKKNRLGRGTGSGSGKTCGRGTKGQKSRSGFNIPLRFEGGQTPLIQRLPKKIGFKGRHIKPVIVKTSVIDNKFSVGDTVSPKTLKEKGIVKKLNKKQAIKILFDKPIKKKLILKDCLASKKAKKSFEK